MNEFTDFDDFEDLHNEPDFDLEDQWEMDLSSDTYHRVSKHPLYKKLAGMIDRCTNPKNKNYKYWGGKGIRVFHEWDSLSKFPFFYEWSISTGWKEGMELDRINPEKNYEPSNLQWLERSEHAKKTINDDRRRKYFSDPDQTEIDF